MEIEVVFHNLHLLQYTNKFLYDIQALIQQNVAVLPEFPMLSHLELGLIRFDVFLGLLQRSPILKTLTFKVGIITFNNVNSNNLLLIHYIITVAYHTKQTAKCCRVLIVISNQSAVFRQIYLYFCLCKFY
jgi:hypothetical protein